MEIKNRQSGNSSATSSLAACATANCAGKRSIKMSRIFAVAILATLFCLANAAAQDCAATAKAPWTWGAGGSRANAQLIITASTVGDDCHSAKATIKIHALDGRMIFAVARPTAQVTTLADATSAIQMTKALQTWVDSTTCPVGGSDALPPWKRGKPAVEASGNTPFIATLSREAYLRHRAAAEPLLCFIQGAESVNALAVSPDGKFVTRIGSFAMSH